MAQYYERLTATDLESALKICLELREHDYWSFRGQRIASWHLGVHGIDRFNELDNYLQQFKRRCMEFPPPQHIEESDMWRWLFFAQHHRLKTRLLDWTKDPLVAIYFAVENILSRKDDESDFGAIWALHVNRQHFKNPEDLLRTPEDIREWVLINPPPFTIRLARQSGLFAYSPAESQLVPLDQMPRRGDERLIKIEIVAKNSKNPTVSIRRQLGILNVHHASLFPDPNGIAHFINQEWSILGYDEHLGLKDRNLE